jgi:hypothetical protein
MRRGGGRDQPAAMLRATGRGDMTAAAAAVIDSLVIVPFLTPRNRAEAK